MSETEKKIRSLSGSLPTNIRRRESSISESAGRIPPQAVDLEEAVLGAVMLEKNALSEIIDILQPEAFYKESHREIYECIRELFNEGEAIDILTVTNALRKKNKLQFVGGAHTISELTNRVASSANIDYHARIVAEKYILRELIRISSEIQKDAFEASADVFDILDDAEQKLFNVTEGNLKNSYSPMSSLVDQAIRSIEERSKSGEGLSGIPSGFSALDRITNGWQRSDLIIIAARPGMGKTALALTMARNAAVDHKKPAAIFSLEMSSVQLVSRLLSSEARINAEKLRSGNVEDHEIEQINHKTDKLSEAEIYIDDTPGINIFELRAKCRRLKAQKDIQLIVIDYLQLMNGDSSNRKIGNREQEISNISRSLKGIAKELGVPVIALSQLSRAVETRGTSKKPQLSDLRESGSIEQDADQVLFVYRPEYYNIPETEEGMPTDGLAQLLIAKNRHGKTDTVNLKFIKEFATFEDDPGVFTGDAPSGFVTLGSRMNDEDEQVF